MSGLACAACSTENPADARFCMGCGAALERVCPSCARVKEFFEGIGE